MSFIKNTGFLALAELAEKNKKMRFVSSRCLSFPVSDVVQYSEDTDEVQLGFMGLTGVDSPLPYYLQSHPLLKILEHKLYGLFYQAVKKSLNTSGYSDYIKSSFSESRENVYQELKEYFSDIKIEVREFVPRWITLTSTSNRIGEMILGERVLSSTFLIMIPRYEDHVVIGQWIMR